MTRFKPSLKNATYDASSEAIKFYSVKTYYKMKGQASCTSLEIKIHYFLKITKRGNEKFALINM